MSHQPKMGWLYGLIILCLAFSGVTAWSLLDKLDGQREAAESYAELSRQAVVTGETVFADETLAPADAAGPSEAEAEDQRDTVQFLENDVVVVPITLSTPQTLATVAATLPGGATVAPSATRPPTGSGWAVESGASATPAAGAPTASPAQTRAPETAEASPTMASAATGASAVPTASPLATGIQATVAASPAASLTPATAAPTPTPEPWRERVVTMDSVRYSVDFGYLQSINEDVKAWLVQDGTVINYPVMQGKDNDEYLDKLFNGKQSKDGSIFLDSGSAATFDDANTYLYGHHTRTDAMFSTLANYRDQAYYDAHPQMILLTPYGDYCVDLFAASVCAVDDETSWRVKQFTRKSEFTAYLKNLEAQSLFQAHDDAQPAWGDQLLVLVTCTNEQHGERYVVYGRMRPIAYTGDESVNVTKMTLDEQDTLTRWQEVPGRGQMMVYAQNDPLWNNMRYESRTSSKRRLFGEGGCGPTSVAMAVVNLVPRERLADIYGYAKSSLGYTFCECSVNQYFCNKLHPQYQIQTADEYLRYFPVVMANFATGNNLWGQVSRTQNPGTVLNFLRKVAYLYKLDLQTTYDNDEAFAAVADGALAIASLGSENPFTGGGHYVVVASVTDQYLYILDPYRQDNYDKTDRKHILTTIAPGVVRVARSDSRNLFMATFYILRATSQTDSPDPPAVQ